MFDSVWFVLAIIAAVATPFSDALSMVLIWVPMVLLFELGYFFYRRWGGSGPGV